MAHALEVTKTGKVPMAYVGDTPWHHLGQKLDRRASVDTWIKEAGFDWSIKSKAIHFKGEDGKQKIFDGKKILSRSDDSHPLSIVSDAYKVVQPKEILEFFQDLVGVAGMTLSTAGILYHGKQFWAMAETNNWGVLNGNDEVKGSLLLSTSCDGSLATTAQFVATRVVCANTLRLALAEHGAKFSVSHRKVFDAREVKEKLGLVNESWETFMANINVLATQTIKEQEAFDLATEFMNTIRKSEKSVQKNTEVIMDYFRNGMGNEGKTKWDLLNGITQHFQHDMKNIRGDDNRFFNNFYGWHADVKDKGFQFLMDSVGKPKASRKLAAVQ